MGLIANMFSGHSGTEIDNTKNLEKFTNMMPNDQWYKKDIFKENKKGILRKINGNTAFKNLMY